MPSCVGCGRWYSIASYPVSYTPSQDVCPSCTAASNGQSYVNSKEWVCESVSNGTQIQHHLAPDGG